MKRYYCNCCGCDFSEDEGRKAYIFSPEYYEQIICPMCEAPYDEAESFIECYKE